MSESTNTVAIWYQFALQQLAADSYLSGLTSNTAKIDALVNGNNGYTRMADAQANSFMTRYQLDFVHS